MTRDAKDYLIEFAHTYINDAIITFSQQSFWITPISVDSKESQEIELNQADIEPGGPQPRTNLDPKSVMALAKQIEKDGEQKTPIDCYPSPINQGKYRVSNGHRRFEAIFVFLKWPKIKARIRKMTESQAWENAIVQNVTQEKLNDFDLGKTLQLLLDTYPDKYPTQEALIINFPCLKDYYGITNRSRVSQLISDYELKTGVIKKISPSNVTAVTNIPERVSREVRNAPISAQPSLLEEIASKKLTSDQTKEVVNKLKENQNITPEPTKTDVIKAISQVLNEQKQVKNEDKELTAEEKLRALFGATQKEFSKYDRMIAKLIEDSSIKAPENLVRYLVGQAGDDKVTPEKLNKFLPTLLEEMYQTLKKDGKLDAVYEAAVTNREH